MLQRLRSAERQQLGLEDYDSDADVSSCVKATQLTAVTYVMSSRDCWSRSLGQ